MGAILSVRAIRLTVEGLSKTFPGQRALDNVSLAVAGGEVHALLGQNGSGKSTLIKILAGYHQPDPGGFATYDGTPLVLGDAEAAHACGIRFIHQDLGLLPDLSIADNLLLENENGSRWWVDERSDARRAQKLLAEWDLHVDPRLPLRSLSQSQRTMVAIIRAVGGGLAASGMLILDEPSAALPAHEVAQLFGLIGQLTERGVGVLYVTHRLSEVLEIADTVTVLRDGRSVGTRTVAGLSYDELVTMIVGRSVTDVFPEPVETSGRQVLEVTGLTGETVSGLSFGIDAGEIVGLAGLSGSGREAVAELVFGIRSRAAGRVVVDGAELEGDAPAQSIRRGLALVPADRKGLGSLPDLTVRENVSLPALPSGSLRWLSNRAESRDVGTWLARLGVVPQDPDRPLSSLSGGNQQRALIARWLRLGAKVFLMDEPTQGVDIEAKIVIYQIMRDAAGAGAGVLFASTDNDELCAVCDRVMVMREGQIVSALHGRHLTSDALLEHSMERQRG